MKKNFLTFLAVLTAAVFLLSGCGSAAKTGNDAYVSYTAAENHVSYTDNEKQKDGAAFGYADREESGIAETEAAAPASPADSSGNSAAEDGRKLIKRYSLSIETKAFEDAVSAVKQLVNDCGGYIEQGNTSSNGYSANKYSTRRAEFVLRIPVENMADFELGAADIGLITNQSETVSDVTLKWTDTESRIKALEIQRDNLLEMMKKAEELSDMLTIQDHLTGVEYELESYSSSLRMLANQVEYSSVSLSLQEVKDFTDITEPETFGEQISEAFKNSLKQVGEFFKNLALFLIGNLPSLLTAAVIIVLAVLGIRKRLHVRKAKKEKKQSGQDGGTPEG